MVRGRRPYIHSKDYRERRTRAIKYLVITLVIALVIAFVGAVLVIRIDALQIREVSYDGLNVLNEDDLNNLIFNELKGTSLFGMIPHTSVFLMSPSRIEHVLKDAFPRIQTIDVKYPRPQDAHTLRVDIVERLPYGIWCNTDTSCFFFDDTAFIFERSPEISSGVYPRFLSTRTDQTIGDQFTTQIRLRLYYDLYHRLESEGLEISHVDFSEKHLQYVFAPASQISGVLITPSQFEVGQIIDALRIFIEEQGVVEGEKIYMEYIDVRSPERIIFKRDE